MSVRATRVSDVSQALYRRYRPETFADVIGQEHVTEPLMQALRTGRVNHAYLFSGPRGCGKTTSARILARCLNCEQGPTPTPCGECDSCVALARGGPGTIDVIEIDAASHGGVDDARELRERASFGPAQSRYKVYIIDEAHMVTPQGFNALLKIVEEPPEHVKFVFATTEPEKVIGTIRSRTHHYPFRLVPPGQLTGYLERVCAAEQVTVEPGVLSFVTRAGGGSVRDSLSVLDQLIAGSDAGGLTYERAASILGFTDGELLDAAIDAFGAGDAASAFAAVERVVETGLDPRRFVEDLLERFRDLIVVHAVPEATSAVLRGIPSDQLERMRAQASVFGPGALSHAADVVNAGLAEMTGAISPRLQLELIAARLLLPGAAGERGYAARLDRLERRLDMGGVPSAGAGGAARPPARGTSGSVPSGPEPGPVETVATSRQASPAPPVAPVAVPTTPPQAESAALSRPGPTQEAGPGEGAVSGGETGTGSDAAGPAAAFPATAGESAPQNGPRGLDTAALRRAWPDVLARLFGQKRASWTLVSEHAQVHHFDGRRLVLGLATPGLAQAFRQGPHAEYVRQALIDVLGVDAVIEVAEPGGDAGARGPRPIRGTSEPVPGPGAPSGGAAPDPRSRRPSLPPQERARARAEAATRRGLETAAAAPEAAVATREAAAPPVAAAAPEEPAAPGPGRSPTRQVKVVQPVTGRSAGGPQPGTPPESATQHPESAGPPMPYVDQPAAWGSRPAGAAPSWASATPGLDLPPPAMHPPDPVVDDETDGSAVSMDDEDIEELGEVGVPVVERLLGGTIIRDEAT